MNVYQRRRARTPRQTADLLFEDSKRRLCELASRAIARAYNPDTALLVVIQADSYWKDLADHLMSTTTKETDWEARWRTHREQGRIPVARGYVERKEAVEALSLAVPAIAPVLARRPKRGAFQAVVCVEGGASVYEVTPRPEPS